MQLKEEERRYLACLAEGMTFAEMAEELGWTLEEVEEFGSCFFERVFERQRRSRQLTGR